MKNRHTPILALLILLVSTFSVFANEFKSSTEGRWDVSVRESVWDESKEYLIFTKSDNTTPDILGLSMEHGRFGVRCMDNTSSVLYIPYGDFRISFSVDRPLVKYRINKNEPESKYWSVTTDREAVGAWSSDGIAFMKKLYKSDATKLVLRVRGYDSTAEHVFNVSGIKPQIEKIADACNWKIN